MFSRQRVVDLVNSWEGRNEKDGSHKEIIDIYNSYKPLPRGIPMQYNWAWCACIWSALAIDLEYTSIMPIEISCGDLIERAKIKSCWVENDGYIPQPGDAVLYDWSDSGKGDNTGWPDHVGTVIYTNKESGYFVVMEGNYSNSVKKRTVSINGKYIRGFIAPKYDDNSVAIEIKPGKDNKTIAREVIAGMWGNGPERVELLTGCGYDAKAIQALVNDILNNPEKDAYESTCKPTVYDSKNVGIYKTTTSLYLRNDAGSNKKALVVMPKDTKVICSGHGAIFNGSMWLYGTAEVDGTTYLGFCSSKYLERV